MEQQGAPDSLARSRGRQCKGWGSLYRTRASGSRLQVKALCRQLLQQVQERHSGPGGVTLTRAHVAAVLQRKAAANKLVLSPEGFVSLPLPRVTA
ncbi:hypothetical protein V8C86DRAFT_3091089 [Haematococcus lacustris]